MSAFLLEKTYADMALETENLFERRELIPSFSAVRCVGKWPIPIPTPKTFYTPVQTGWILVNL